MGSDPSMEVRKPLLKRWRLGSDLFKPRRKPMKLRGEDFRQAQDDPDVKSFLDEAMKQDEKLHDEGLIHP